MKRTLTFLVGLALAVCANAQGGDFSSDNFPQGEYRQVNPVHFGPITIHDLKMHDLTPHPVPLAPGFFDVFTDVWEGSIGRGGAGVPDGTVHSFFDITYRIQYLGQSGTTRFFHTEMLAMHLNGLPPGEPWTAWDLRESPTLQSTGQVAITALPGSGSGMYHIDSFFDVFTELSIDGGNSWLPGDTSMHVQGQPEPATFLAMGAGLAILVARKRRK